MGDAWAAGVVGGRRLPHRAVVRLPYRAVGLGCHLALALKDHRGAILPMLTPLTEERRRRPAHILLLKLRVLAPESVVVLRRHASDDRDGTDAKAMAMRWRCDGDAMAMRWRCDGDRSARKLQAEVRTSASSATSWAGTGGGA